MSIAIVESFKEMPTRRKVAIGVGAAAAVGVTALAYAKGRKSDAFINSLNAVNQKQEGAKKLGFFKTVGEGFKMAWNAVLNKLPKKAQNVQTAEPDVVVK